MDLVERIHNKIITKSQITEKTKKVAENNLKQKLKYSYLANDVHPCMTSSIKRPELPLKNLER